MSIKIGRILITYRFNPPKYDPHSPYYIEALGRLVVGGGYRVFAERTWLQFWDFLNC